MPHFKKVIRPLRRVPSISQQQAAVLRCGSELSPTVCVRYIIDELHHYFVLRHVPSYVAYDGSVLPVFQLTYQFFVASVLYCASFVYQH
jgi:hypothetical protein